MGTLKSAKKRGSRGASLSEKRFAGAHQIESTRARIVEAAEKVFLSRGLENASMLDVAEAAGITKVTLYRYFPDRHPIAFAVAERALGRILEVAVPPNSPDLPFAQLARSFLIGVIDSFHSLEDSFRYLDLFDHLYASGYPDDESASAYKVGIEQAIDSALFAATTNRKPEDRERSILEARGSPAFGRTMMTLNAIQSFLEKMASRGELMSEEQGLSREAQLIEFRRMIETWFDASIAPLMGAQVGGR
jgi:AcrR family transcriptional regulator